MTKSLIVLLVLTVAVFSLDSCRKDKGFEEAVYIDSTDYRFDYVGNWSFKSSTQDDQWIYEFDSTGSGGFQHYQTTSTNWEYETGTVEGSPYPNQIIVKFSENHSALSMVVNSQGHLSCVDDCSKYGFYNDPQTGGNGPQGCWHIDSTYCQALGGSNLPGHVTSTTITGFKIE
ncbi:MAG: hypothetical protein ABJG68_17030 [Crocinitomicaceae bacterium]